MINTDACFIDCMGRIKELDIVEGVSFHELKILQEFLGHVAKDHCRVIEIGSWKGCSTYFLAHILNHFKNCGIWCIDTWGGNEGTWNKEEVNKYNIRNIFEHNISPFKDIIAIVNEDSKTAHTQFKNESIDFIFIDGDHSYGGALADLKNYYPKLRIGGIISGHDSNVRFENLSKGGQKEVDEYRDVDCVPLESTGKRVHCGVTRALYDMFGSSYHRTGDYGSPYWVNSDKIKNSLWWKIKE